jgi:cysteinyl-tRNA synthetase
MSETTKSKMPDWYKPTNGVHTGIKILNSLTHEKNEFIPIDPQGRRVNWYTCGPTVYDMSHMGHARSYVGFDILRRIMEDYFRFDVTYVINVTDIDDKIIKKANRIALVKTVENVSKLQNDKLKQLVSEYEEKLKMDAEAKDKKFQLTMRQIYEMRKNLVKAAEEVGIKNIEVEPDFIGVPRFYEKMFWRDLKSLNCRPPSIIVRVTEFVPEIVQFIQKIMDNGFAYESDGSVYFDVDAFRNARGKDGKVVTGNSENEEKFFKFVYGKLEPWSVEDSEKLKEGEGESQTDTEKKITKRSPRDFALWKKSVPGEPSWDSPWSKGRPGWHIECSAMATYAFQNASSIDIHCGGVDLRFPHHDNELAQSEAHFCCKQWVNYFLHAGHLSIEGLTMSKSKKNFLTIADQLENVYNARQVRLLFLMHKYNDPMDYSASTMKAAIDIERMFVEFFANIKIVLREESYTQYEKWEKREFDLSNFLSEKKKQIHDALCDSFNTPLVMKHLIDLKDATNAYLQSFLVSEKTKTPNLPLLRSVAAYVTDMFRIFGLIDTDSLGFSLSSDAGSESNFEEKIRPLLDAFTQFRDDVRSISRDGLDNKELTKNELAQLVLRKCDQVRDDILPQLGVRLEDRPDIGKAVWKLEDVKTLMLERQRKLDEEQEKIQKKLQQLEESLRKARDAYEKILQDPAQMFRQMDLYSEWDEKGIPTKLKDGTELTKSNRKKLEKEYSKQVVAFNDQKKRATLEKDLKDKEAALQKFKLQRR